MTPLPVIGVPVPLKQLDGLDSLALDRADARGDPGRDRSRSATPSNAGLLAVRILGTSNPTLRDLVAAQHARRRGSRPRQGRQAPTTSTDPPAQREVVRADLVGAAGGAFDDVGHPFDGRVGEHRPDELDLRRARVSVAAGHREDRAVLFDDEEAAVGLREPRGDVAVVVEDPGQLGDAVREVEAAEPHLRLLDPTLTTAGEEPLDEAGVLGGDTVEELVAELVVGLGEERFARGRQRPEMLRPTRSGPLLTPRRRDRRSWSAASCWRTPLTVMPRRSASVSARASPARLSSRSSA